MRRDFFFNHMHRGLAKNLEAIFKSPIELKPRIQSFQTFDW